VILPWSGGSEKIFLDWDVPKTRKPPSFGDGDSYGFGKNNQGKCEHKDVL